MAIDLSVTGYRHPSVNLRGQHRLDNERHKCTVRGCTAPAHHVRATQIHTYPLCADHAAAWDEGRVVGSLVSGYRVASKMEI